jgi:hypothetical protein
LRSTVRVASTNFTWDTFEEYTQSIGCCVNLNRLGKFDMNKLLTAMIMGLSFSGAFAQAPAAPAAAAPVAATAPAPAAPAAAVAKTEKKATKEQAKAKPAATKQVKAVEKKEEAKK